MEQLDESERSEIDAAVARALAPYNERPDAVGVAHIVDDLITCGQRLHARIAGLPRSERTPQAAGALADWEYAIAAGPSRSDAAANWNYARGVARIVTSLGRAVRDYQPASLL